MFKVAFVILFLSLQLAFAGNCINLSEYNLSGSGNYSASEQSDFKKGKFNIYRSYILNENKITNYYTSEIESLYEDSLSDQQISAQLKKLQNQRKNKLALNCSNHKIKLLNLIKTF